MADFILCAEGFVSGGVRLQSRQPQLLRHWRRRRSITLNVAVNLTGEDYATIVTSVSYVMPNGMHSGLRTIDLTATIGINLTGNKIPGPIIGTAGTNILAGSGGWTAC